MKYDVVMTRMRRTKPRQGILLRHYQQGKWQEDLCFALWRSSTGLNRKAAIVYEIILPQEGERESHGECQLHPRICRQSHLGSPSAECRHSVYAQPSQVRLARPELPG